MKMVNIGQVRPCPIASLEHISASSYSIPLPLDHAASMMRSDPIRARVTDAICGIISSLGRARRRPTHFTAHYWNKSYENKFREATRKSLIDGRTGVARRARVLLDARKSLSRQGVITDKRAGTGSQSDFYGLDTIELTLARELVQVLAR